MGYRSNVYGKMKIELADEFKKLLVDNKIDLTEVSEDKDYLYFFDEYVKWYSEYDDVKIIEKFIADHQESAMIIIGEDNAVSIKNDPYELEMYERTTVSGHPRGEG